MRIDLDHRTLAREVIHHGEPPEHASVGQRIANEIHRPPLVWARGHRWRDARRTGALPPAPPLHGQALLPVEPLRALVIAHEPLALQQPMQTRTPPARALRGELAQAPAHPG